jgi:hypothetical protein
VIKKGGTEKEAIQVGNNVARSHASIGPSKTSIGRFNVHEVEGGDKIIEVFF